MLTLYRSWVRKIVLTVGMLAAAVISAHASGYSYSFDNTPLSEAIVRICKDHPETNISFIYEELDSYRTSAKINADDIEVVLRRIVGLNPVAVIQKDGSYFIEALQHGRFVYTGRAVGNDGEPVFATVVLLAPRDSSMITYGVADNEGHFSIPCDRRDVIAKLSCIGYHTLYRRCRDFNLGNIVMTVNPTMLGPVSVTASKSFVTVKGTGLAVDIENSPLGDLPTVTDILSQLPSVKFTGSGFSVMGRGDAVIFIGNRKIQDMSELYRLRPSEIKSVEIIRNPGAEFDADAAAVIRIRLKKTVLKGLGVNVMSQGSLGRRFSDYEQLSLTYGAGATNSFLILSNNSSRLDCDQTNRQDTYAPSAVWRMCSDMPRWRSEFYNRSISAGTSVGVADNHTLGAKITYSDDRQRNAGEKYSDMTVGCETYENLTARTSNPQEYCQWHANLYYEGMISGKVNFTFNGDYVNRNHHSTHFTDESGSLTPQHSVVSTGRTRYNLWSGLAKMNWKPTENSQVVFGADVSTVNQCRRHSDNISEGISILNSTDSKYAVFGQYNLSHSIWNFGLGLRYEADKMDYADGSTGGRILARTYHRLYPDLTVSADVGRTTMSVGFTSRIKRPTFYQLRTSSEYFNRYETTEGNPLLRPRYTYDLSYSFGYRNLTVSAGYRWVYNHFTEESRIDAENPLHLTSYPVNKAKYTAASLLVNYNHRFGFWQPYVSLQLTKTFYDCSFADDMPRLGSAPLIELSFSGYFTFCGTTAYFVADCNTAGAYCNSWEGSYAGVDIGIYRRFLDRSLYVALTATNVFGCSANSRTYYGTSIFEKTVFRDNRRVYLTVSYTLRHNDKYKGKTSAQDEINRM